MLFTICSCQSLVDKQICKHIIAVTLYFDSCNNKIIRRYNDFTDDEIDISRPDILITDSSDSDRDQGSEDNDNISFESRGNSNSFTSMSSFSDDEYECFKDDLPLFQNKIICINIAYKVRSIVKKEKKRLNLEEVDNAITKMYSLYEIKNYSVLYR